MQGPNGFPIKDRPSPLPQEDYQTPRRYPVKIPDKWTGKHTPAIEKIAKNAGAGLKGGLRGMPLANVALTALDLYLILKDRNPGGFQPATGLTFHAWCNPLATPSRWAISANDLCGGNLPDGFGNPLSDPLPANTGGTPQFIRYARPGNWNSVFQSDTYAFYVQPGFHPGGPNEADASPPQVMPKPQPQDAGRWRTKDPLLVPPKWPWADPKPLPYEQIPKRQPNPYRSPDEQTQRGPKQRTQRRLNEGPLYLPTVGGRPIRGRLGVPLSGIEMTPGVKPQWSAVRTPHKYAKVGARTKERKLITSIPARSIVGMLMSIATEGMDLVTAMYDALPEKYKNRTGRIQDMALDVYNNLDKIPMREAFYNLLANQIEDYALGRIGQLVGQSKSYAWELGYAEANQLSQTAMPDHPKVEELDIAPDWWKDFEAWRKQGRSVDGTPLPPPPPPKER